MGTTLLFLDTLPLAAVEEGEFILLRLMAKTADLVAAALQVQVRLKQGKVHPVKETMGRPIQRVGLLYTKAAVEAGQDLRLL
jgi:hypothetical protein